MSEKSHFTVVRNAAYTAKSIGVRERHNERKNESYYNADIEPERAKLNVHYCRNFTADGLPETYEQTFNRLLEEKVIVKRGLKADAKVFDELVFDVNTAYFEENGGYDFAKKFYEAAYQLAVAEVGGEEYILSAVMYADEKNTALSEQLGREAQLLDGCDNCFILVVIRSKAVHQLFRVGILLNAAFLKLIKLQASLSIQVFSVNNESLLST